MKASLAMPPKGFGGFAGRAAKPGPSKNQRGEQQYELR